MTLVFAPSPRTVDDRIVVFHHIRKTAGTALTKTIQLAYPDSDPVTVLYPDYAPDRLRAWWQRLFALMTEEERSTLRAVCSHTAGFCLDLVPRPAVGITMVRDPIDQALSRWFFSADVHSIDDLCRQYEQGPWWWANARRPLSHRKGRRFRGCFNPQARTLLEPHFDVDELDIVMGPPPDADLWRARLFSLLSRRFLVGVQDAFEDSVARFAEEFGWPRPERKRMVTAKVNLDRPRPCPLDRETADMIRSANWLDVELYARYRRAFGAPRESGPPGYVIR